MHAPSGVALVSTDGTFLRTNPALERMLGRTGEELKRLRWQDLVHPDDLEAGKEAGERARRGQPFDEVFRVRHAQGHELILRASGRSIAGRQGWFAVHYEDLTEREVARLLGCTVGTVKSQNARALDKLRQFLDEPSHTVSR